MSELLNECCQSKCVSEAILCFEYKNLLIIFSFRRSVEEETTTYKMIKTGERINRSANRSFQKPTNQDDTPGLRLGPTTTDLLVRLMDEKIRKDNSDGDSIKILVLHSQNDSTKAGELVEVLNKEHKIRAVADSQLSVFKMMSFLSYIRAAIEWADVVAVLMTDNYIEDVRNIDCSKRRPNSSLHTRHGFVSLQHKLFNSDGFPAVAIVHEEMHHNCYEFPELKCIHWKKDFSEIKETILKLYNPISPAEEERTFIEFKPPEI